MASRLVTLAFAGAGTTTKKNAEDLLDDFLGIENKDLPRDLDLRLIFPASKKHITKTLDLVYNWSADRSLEYDAVFDKDYSSSDNATKDYIKDATDTVESENVNADLIDQLVSDREADKDAEVYLVLAWGEKGDDLSEDLLDKAKPLEIPTLDLTAGLDDLDFKEDEPDADTEPPPEEEPPARRRRGRSRSANEDNAEESSNEDKPAPRTRGRSRAKSLDEPERDLPDDKPAPARRRSRAKPKATDEAQATPEVNEALAEGQESHQEKVARLREETEANHKAARAKVDARNASVPFSGDLGRKFNFHRANEVTVPKHEKLRELTLRLAQVYEEIIPDEAQHEKHCAITQLEAALMWANAGVARYEGGENPTTGQKAADDKPAGRRSAGRRRNDGSPAQARTPRERAVQQIWDEEEEAWKPKGRGRPPKGSKIRWIDPKTGEAVDVTDE